MSFSKDYVRSKKLLSISELKLDLPHKDIRHSKSNHPRNEQHMSNELKKRFNVAKQCTSTNTVSVQNIELPEGLSKKPFMKVKCPPYDNVRGSCRNAKRHVSNVDSSSNSRLAGWVVTTPRKLKARCSATSSSEARPSPSMTTSSISSSMRSTVGTSEEMKGFMHPGSNKRFNFKGSEWQKPCRESFVVGAPRQYVGTCPEDIKHLARLSTNRQKFFLTQDPRRTHCLRNPEALRKKAYSPRKGFNALTAMVEQADNACNATTSQTSESFICEVVDLENPMQLDFQGLDYKNTYLNDEQDIQNQFVLRHVTRFMDRKRIKEETETIVETQLQNDRLAIPPCFTVTNRNEELPPTPSEESVHFGKLYRTTDKPYNRAIITEEHNRRVERYKNMYLKKKRKMEKVREKEEKAEKTQTEFRASALMMKNFNEALEQINDDIRQTFRQQRTLKRKEIQRRTFPHTLRETIAFRRDLKDKKRVERDKAKVKSEFFMERLGKIKKYPEAEMEISSDTARHTDDDRISEQSSDDADALEVGKRDQQFKLRGFHFTLGDSIRGKLHENKRKTVKGQRREKGCITREKWLASLAPEKEKVKIDVEPGIEKLKSPDDPEMTLFPPRFHHSPVRTKASPVREFRQQEIGRQYHRMRRKKIKLVKPKLRYSVKKFNLIKFLYREKDKKDRTHRDSEKDVDKGLTQKTTQQYIDAKARLHQRYQEKMKLKRLEILGLPCRILKKSRLQTKCENSESDSGSEWVPSTDQEMPSDSEVSRTRAHINRVPLAQRGNMPAPRYRESTLRRHPKHPRDYLGQRVPSEQFGQAVQTKAVPIMHKLKGETRSYANVNMLKCPYTKMFDARHHHDHYDPTKKNLVNVHYQVQKVVSDITKVKQKEDRKIAEHFQMANPPCNAYVDMDVTLPRYNIDSMIAERSLKSKQKEITAAQELTKNVCHAKDFVYHSRKENEKLDDFQGHQEYLEFLHEIRQQLQEKKETAKTDEGLYVDRNKLYKELEEDLKSIESCLSSLSSSECTNLTNDSGSFLLMEGKTKVPLDYIRKSLVPFEELQRSRFKFIPISPNNTRANPFQLMPFPGQLKDQKQLSGPKDSFFTFHTRLQNGLRMRLEIPVEDVRQKLLGPSRSKYPCVVTTDIDENYVEELKNRPSVKMFRFKSCGSMVKDALRLKFESLLIQGQIVRTKIYDRLNEKHWEQMQHTKLLFEKLFVKWEKKEYEASMEVVYKVKSYYNMTDIMKRQFRELEREELLLNMDIVYIEDDWIRRVMLQNFHYLLADADWRYENDWIHRIDPSDPNSELENFEESISKRSKVNIRQREKDDAWAIKTYYEEQYLQNKHAVLIVFPDADSFLKGIENLKNKTFVLLLELHFTLGMHTELSGRLATFEEWCAQDLAEKKEYVDRKCAKKYFLFDRANQLKEQTINFVGEPLEKSFNDETFVHDRALIVELWRQIIPANIRGSSEKDFEIIDMVAMMADLLLELLANFEKIPVTERIRVENNMRKQRKYLQKISYQASQIEKRIEIEMKNVRKNLEPPFKKPKRKGRLPRARIKKIIPKEVVEEKHISEHTKFFFRAFHDEGDVTQFEEARESLFDVDTIQEQIVPFYFDHFLKINGYTPTYNFKTQIEMRDGPEVNRFQVRHVIPGITYKMEAWEAMRRRIMEENISRNPQMYINVNF